MKFKIRAVIFLLIIIIISGTLIYQFRYNFLINKGIYLYNRGRYEEAVNKLLPLTERALDNFNAVLYIAQSYLMLNQYDKSVETIESFKLNNPQNIKADFLLGQVHFRYGNIDKSASAFLEYINKIEPDWKKYDDFFAINILNFKDGRFKSVIDNYKNIKFKLSEENEKDLLVLKGLCYDKMGLWIEAEKCYEKALNMKNRNPIISFRLGLIYAAKNLNDDAKYMFDLSKYFNYPVEYYLKKEMDKDFKRMNIFFNNPELNAYEQNYEYFKNYWECFVSIYNYDSQTSQTIKNVSLAKKADLNSATAALKYEIKNNIKKGIVNNNGEIVLFKNTNIEIPVISECDGFHDLYIFYRASPSSFIFPWIKVDINGLYIKNYYARSLKEDYIKVTVYLSSGSNVISISYTNDNVYNNPKEDRNFYLLKIFLSPLEKV